MTSAYYEQMMYLSLYSNMLKIIQTETVMKVGIYSFFSGAGFLDLGFEKNKNYEIQYVNEYHQPFLDVYINSRKLMGVDDPIHGFSNDNILSLSEPEKDQELIGYLDKSSKSTDLIGFIGGPPCPDFSVAGKNKGKDGENGKLSATYADLICKHKPNFFLFENVKGLYRTKKHREFFDSMKANLESAGYTLTEKLINSLAYGAPQDRERIILIGFRFNCNNESIQETLSTSWKKFEKYDMGDLKKLPWPETDLFTEGKKREAPSGIVQELTVGYWFEKNDVANHPNQMHAFTPKAGLAKFKVIEEGDVAKKSYKRLHRWRYSPTAAYGNNEVHLHPYHARRISVAEALSIQSMPKDFGIPANITLTNMFKTIGNGVPYLAGKAMADQIAHIIKEQRKFL